MKKMRWVNKWIKCQFKFNFDYNFDVLDPHGSCEINVLGQALRIMFLSLFFMMFAQALATETASLEARFQDLPVIQTAYP